MGDSHRLYNNSIKKKNNNKKLSQILEAIYIKIKNSKYK